MKLSFLTMMILTACAASHTKPKTPWRIDLVTSGGFAGKGNGNYAISSDGKITITSMGGKVCTFDAAADELAKFETLVANAKPADWKESYIPENPCCDRFQYDLTLDQDGAKRVTRWVDDPDPMPQDLAAIAAALTGPDGSLRVRYQERCR
ncbi:MAG TPA: hypothetical protein VEK11_07860 [Thermoanaerobaculia bacterium]|nr:hypothetical protein [Thermoanaerobaculia bacterium]